MIDFLFIDLVIEPPNWERLDTLPSFGASRDRGVWVNDERCGRIFRADSNRPNPNIIHVI